ncbi:hypothetical protein ABT304_27195 [Nocardioides sp. NPDC000445]|uniref:DUF6980 family protein n=1 Tax=Nocardioides sp. NPDC000445 TaxID=3154257 RepID=UPI0033256230
MPAIASLLPRITRNILRRRPRDLCCTALAEHLDFECRLHRDPLHCADAVIFRDDSGRIGLPIHDGGSSYIAIRHCPWCGTRLRKQPFEAPPVSNRQHLREITCRVRDPEQVRQFLERVSDWTGSLLTDSDWHTVRAGMERLGSESDTQVSYLIDGWTAITAYVTKAPKAENIRLQVVGEIDDLLAARIETLIELLG